MRSTTASGRRGCERRCSSARARGLERTHDRTALAVVQAAALLVALAGTLYADALAFVALDARSKAAATIRRACDCEQAAEQQRCAAEDATRRAYDCAR